MGSDTSRKSDGQGKGGLAALWEIRFRAVPEVVADVRTMVVDPTLRVNAVADTALKDTALVIEFIKASSSMQYSEGKPPVTTMKAAIERLGGKGSIETLDGMEVYPEFDPEIADWVEIYRSKNRRAGMVSRIVAETLAPSLAEDCHLAGSLIFVGDMLAPVFFGTVYTKYAAQNARSKVLYKLEKDHGFDVKKIGLTYLRKSGLPESILFALDEDGQTKQPARGPMKQVVAVSEEMLLYFDSGKWEKMAPGQTLPPKSPIRLMRVTDMQYLKLYEKVGEFLDPQLAASRS